MEKSCTSCSINTAGYHEPDCPVSPQVPGWNVPAILGPLTIRGLGGEAILCCDACYCQKATDGTYITRLCSLHAAATELLEIVRTVVNLGLLPHHEEREAARALLNRIRGRA